MLADVTIIRQVNQRVCLAERATESLRKRVDELAEDVSSVGGTVRQVSASTQSQRDATEQLVADETRNRYKYLHNYNCCPSKFNVG